MTPLHRSHAVAAVGRPHDGLAAALDRNTEVLEQLLSHVMAGNRRPVATPSRQQRRRRLGVCIRWTGPLDWTTGLDYWTHE